MTKKKAFIWKFAILFSGISILAAGITIACVDSEVDEKYGSNFSPEISQLDKTYTPLFLSNFVFYSIGYDGDFISRFNQDMLSDWSTYLEGKIGESDLSYFLLDTISTKDINQLYSVITRNQPDAKWSKKIDLMDPKVKSFITYLKLAKKIESKSTVQIDPWEYEPITPQYVDLGTIKQAETRYREETDLFIKNRYWYQTMKAKFYSSDRSSVIPFFNSTKDLTTKNQLYYRAVAYVAGAYYKQKNYAKANYLYSLVFKNCPIMRTTAAYNFHPQEQFDFDASLEMAADNYERTALWTLYGYYGDEKQAIKEIYAIDNQSEYLHLLLTRLINKEETRLNSEEFTDAIDYKNNIRESMDQEVFQLVNSIALENKTSKPYLWNIAAGYLNILAGKQEVASRFFASSKSDAPQSRLVKDQIRLLLLIKTLFSMNSIDAASESSLLPELTWLYGNHDNGSDDFRYQQAVDWSRGYISSLYKNQNNPVFQELFKPENDFYRKETNRNSMKALMARNEKTNWELLSLQYYTVNLSDIYEYEAVMNTYRGDIKSAIDKMENSSHASDPLPANPFMNKIMDCHDCDHALPQKKRYTKLTFLKKIQELKNKADSAIDPYSNYMLLGHAFYNISYFGNARAFYYGEIMNQYGNYIEPYFQPYLYNSSIAASFYQKALEASTNNEQRARCWYLLSKCERNDFYRDNYHSKEDYYSFGNNEIDFLAWQGFKRLKSEASNTLFFKEVIQECGYFKKFVTKR